MKSLDIDQIRARLHHRYPFLMVDRVTRLEEKEIWGYKNVTHNEPYFPGHFPGFPVMPGVLIVEAMAQLGGLIILGQRDDENRNMLFMGVDRVRFRQPVRPGDKLQMHARLVSHRKAERTEQARIEVRAAVEDKLAASGTFTVGLFPSQE